MYTNTHTHTQLVLNDKCRKNNSLAGVCSLLRKAYLAKAAEKKCTAS